MSDEESTIQQKIKTSTFSLDERRLLLKLINKYYDVVNNKKIDSKSTNEKNQAWVSIHEEFSSSNIIQYSRTAQQLKRCWENLRCKAKKGDASAQKLLKWAENQYQTSKKCNDVEKDSNCQSNNINLALDDDSDGSLSDKDAPANSQSDLTDSLEASLQHLSSENTSDCNHCQCDKMERLVKIRLLKYDKQQMERVYNAKLQNLRLKAKREKELHRLAVHEMTLRVENERRRAEILDKELSLQTY